MLRSVCQARRQDLDLGIRTLPVGQSPFSCHFLLMLVWRDLFAVSSLGPDVVVAAEQSFFVGCVLDIWQGIVETIVFVMSSMMSCAGVPIRKEDSEFARRMGVLLQEMVAAYDDRVDFVWELEVVPGIAAAVKTAEFLNDAL
ncbi:hypothetical protein Tco_1146268 [Tanacetum coccineum]